MGFPVVGVRRPFEHQHTIPIQDTELGLRVYGQPVEDKRIVFVVAIGGDDVRDLEGVVVNITA